MSIRSSLVGFVTGLSLTSLASYVWLLDSYHIENEATRSLISSLSTSVSQLKSQLIKVDTLEYKVEQLQKECAKLQDLQRTRNEVFQSLDDLHVSHLELKNTVWELKEKRSFPE